MAATLPLPKFDRPPVIEVVHGMGFRRLAMHIGHPGMFHECLRERYPRVQTVPALPSHRASHASDRPTLFGLDVPRLDDLPRAWFVSENDTMLVQLQQDRLLLNWRSGRGKGQYPHFAAVAAEFARVSGLLSDFCERLGLGDIEVEHAEMTYVNHMGRWASDKAVDPGVYLRSWATALGPEWAADIESLVANTRHAIRDDKGTTIAALTREIATIADVVSGDRSLQMSISVTGTPGGPDAGAVAAFHAIAHEQIVRCFAATTTDEAHSEWARQA